jgi:hypothetical protein
MTSTKQPPQKPDRFSTGEKIMTAISICEQNAHAAVDAQERTVLR